MYLAILLYDGMCGLCDRAVQFTLRRDRHDIFGFAPLQSRFAAQILQRHRNAPAELSTVALVLNPNLPDEVLLTRSDAVLELLSRLALPWRLLAAFGRLWPQGLRDRIYDWVARNRYRAFGRHEYCEVPAPDQRRKFLSE
jgi:predicted DCC family thiol-disulfide oxidoreductase YuxK